VDIDVTEPAPADSAILRRRLLGIGLGGAAASILPLLSGRASATTTTSSTSDTTAATTTTTSPPRQPTSADNVMLTFAQTLEVAARDLYDVALDTKVFDEMQRSVIATIREAHEAYAASLSAILGRPMAQIPDPIGEDMKAAFSGDLTGVLDAAYTLESTLVATYTEMLGKLQGVNGAALIASILIVEAANGTVLADLKKATDLDKLLVVPEAEALTPLARETP
jgi:hypothetical protein